MASGFAVGTPAICRRDLDGHSPVVDPGGVSGHSKEQPTEPLVFQSSFDHPDLDGVSWKTTLNMLSACAGPSCQQNEQETRSN